MCRSLVLWMDQRLILGGRQMDGPAFKKALKRLGHTQSSFARQYDLSVRTVQNWAKDGVPPFIGRFLEDYARRAIEPPGSRIWSDERSAAQDCEAAVDQLLRDVLLRATQAGWPKRIVLVAAMRWVLDQFLARQ